jgi:hypothetical protein
MCGNSTCHECNQQPLCKQNDCSCPVKDLSTDCVLYTGADLTCSGIKSGTILTDLIQQLDDFICKITEAVGGGGFGLINIGTGSGIYRNTLLSGSKELRSIKAIGDFLEVGISQSGQEIEIKETPVEALRKLEMSFDWKNSDDFNIVKSPTELPSKVTDSIYKRNGFIGYLKPLEFPSSQVQHPNYNSGTTEPILIEADIYNLGIKIKDFNKIKDYSPVVVISKYMPTRKNYTDNPSPIPGSPLEYFPNSTYRKAGFRFSNDNDTVRLTRIPIQAQYQVIDFGQEHYFKTSLEFQTLKSLGGGKIELIFETRGAKQRYSQCKLPYPIGEAGDTGKFPTVTSRAFVYLQFHIEIEVDGIKHISPPLGKLKMIASIDTPAQDTLRFTEGDIIPYDYLFSEYEFRQRTKITFKHT